VTRTSRTRVFAVAALLAVAPALAACGAGFDANLSQPFTPTEAAEASKNGVTVAQAFILGPESGQTLPANSSAPLYLTMVNDNATGDQLTKILPGGADPVETNISLPPRVLVKSANPTPQIVVKNIKNPLRGGESMKVTLQFQNAGAITMIVPVITRSREFATLQPAPSETPDGTEVSPSPSPADGATDAATGEAADQATASPEATEGAH
jgi:hypothetical protein